MALNFVLVVQTGQLPGLSLNYLWLLLPVQLFIAPRLKYLWLLYLLLHNIPSDFPMTKCLLAKRSQSVYAALSIKQI